MCGRDPDPVGSGRLIPIIKFAGADAGKVQQIIDQLGAQGAGVSIKVKVRTKQKRPWWRFWES